MSSGFFKDYVTKNYLFLNHIYLICMYEQNLALNNLQGLVWHKQNQPINQVFSIISVLMIFIKTLVMFFYI